MKKREPDSSKQWSLMGVSIYGDIEDLAEHLPRQPASAAAAWAGDFNGLDGGPF